eukprot:s5564_g10.t1
MSAKRIEAGRKRDAPGYFCSWRALALQHGIPGLRHSGDRMHCRNSISDRATTANTLAEELQDLEGGDSPGRFGECGGSSDREIRPNDSGEQCFERRAAKCQTTPTLAQEARRREFVVSEPFAPSASARSPMSRTRSRGPSGIQEEAGDDHGPSHQNDGVSIGATSTTGNSFATAWMLAVHSRL